MEDLAPQKVGGGDCSGGDASGGVKKRRTMMAHQAMEAQRAAASQANVSRPLGLSKPSRELYAVCVKMEPKDEEQDVYGAPSHIGAKECVLRLLRRVGAKDANDDE